jgi:hypothetical protein
MTAIRYLIVNADDFGYGRGINRGGHGNAQAEIGRHEFPDFPER